MNTLIRNALESDLSRLIDLSRRTINASYRSVLGDEAVDGFLGSGAADRYVQENLEYCSVSCREGQIIAFAVCRENVLELLIVDPDHHRQGFGTELLGHVEATLFQIHAELRLESFENNEIANAFYRRNGWHPVDRQFDEASGVHKLVFRKLA